MITARHDPVLEGAASASGATCFLRKPFEADVLIRCIEDALKSWEDANYIVEPLYSFELALAQDFAALAAYYCRLICGRRPRRQVRDLAEIECKQTRLLELTTGAILVRDRAERAAEQLYGWNRLAAMIRKPRDCRLDRVLADLSTFKAGCAANFQVGKSFAR